MSASWCRSCGRYHWFYACTARPRRCLHVRCELYDTCQIIEMETS